MQTRLEFEQEDYILEEGLEQNRLLGKKIRDYNYKQTIQREDTNIQRNIIKHIIQKHPEGITDLEICIFTGFSRSSVTARRNEIPNVTGVGIAKIRTNDGEGDRLNTLWGIIEGDPLIACGTQKSIPKEDI